VKYSHGNDRQKTIYSDTLGNEESSSDFIFSTEFAFSSVSSICMLLWHAVRFVAGKALSLSKPNLRVYELNAVAWIHHSTGCLQNDYCLWFLSNIIIFTQT